MSNQGLISILYSKSRMPRFAYGISIFLAVCTLLLVAIFAVAGGEKKVAVLELVNKAGITDDEAYALTDQVRVVASRMLPGAQFIVMTSENIQELLPPDMDLKKCDSAQCEVEMGRMLGADYIITGEIIRFGSNLRLNLRAHHSFSAHFVYGGNGSGPDVSALDLAMANPTGQMMAGIMKHAGVAAPARAGGGAVFVQPSQPVSTGGAAEVRALVPTEQPPATATGPAGLYITTNPPGADVHLGQTKAGSASPAFQKVNLQAGTNVRVTLKMSLYHDVSFDVALVPGVMKFEGVELKPAFGSLKIETEPTGAEVFIGGEKVGTTPFSEQRYPSGQYLVTVKKEWYLPQEDQQITVTDGQATAKMIALSQDFGTLDVQSNPAGATVTLDGKELGTTPGTWRVPPVKDGKLEVSYTQYHTKSFEISIDRDQEVKITADQANLEARVGSLQIYAQPPVDNAQVFIDGKHVGVAPATVHGLLAGEHKIDVETEDQAGSTVVTIAEGQTVVAEVGIVGKNVRYGSPTFENPQKMSRYLEFPMPVYNSSYRVDGVTLMTSVAPRDNYIANPWDTPRDLQVIFRFKNGELTRRLIHCPLDRCAFTKSPYFEKNYAQYLAGSASGDPRTNRKVMAAVLMFWTERSAARNVIRSRHIDYLYEWWLKSRVLDERELKGDTAFSPENAKMLEEVGFEVKKPHITPRPEMIVANINYEILKDYDLGHNHLGKVGQIATSSGRSGVTLIKVRRFKLSGDYYDLVDESLLIMTRAKYKEIMDGKK